jgi:hypothetical protein
MTAEDPAPAQQRTAEHGSAPDPKVKGSKRPGPVEFNAIIVREIETIRQRRHAFGISSESDKEIGPGKSPNNLFGIALSGGGIRSSSFCLGALQALDQYGLLCRADYLSTVSGGGYIAASMVAAMNAPATKQAPQKSSEVPGGQAEGRQPLKWAFPFTAGSESDVSDTKLVGYIRDNSKFLAPHGLIDVGISAAVILRGLAVNLLLLLAVLLPLATIIILANPTVEKLEHSILLDWTKSFAPESWSKFSILSAPFVLSAATAIVLVYWLIGWAVWRSYKESRDLQKARKLIVTPANEDPRSRPAKDKQTPPAQEQSGIGAKFGFALLALLIGAFVVELQPWIVNRLIGWMKSEPGESWFGTVLTLGSAAGSIIAFTTVFQSKLVAWIEHSMSSAKWIPWMQAILARAAFYALGLALPLIIYGLFLILVIWGIKLPSASGGDYPHSPDFLVAPDWNLPYLLAATLAILVVLWLCSTIHLHYHQFGELWRKLEALKLAASGVIVAVFAAALVGSAYATRMDSSEQEWIVLINYLLLTAIVIVVAVNFTENANGLHRLYRDRLRHTFKLEQIALHHLNDLCPYLLINGTMNVRRPRKKKVWQALAQRQGGADLVSADPAKRGRNAEFFLLSRHFIGSDITGYACSRELNNQQPELDLAAAVAISGAAVSSSMGRVGIGLLGPTLALLNLRLGYWLLNPSKLDPEQRGWDGIFRRYLFDEAFGRLHSRSPRVYITDGGHIDNIGLYQLLKRRCSFIIVIDAEADPGMNFSAFADVQRFARIDEGVRITLDWHPVRAAALSRLEDRTKSPVPVSHKLHFAAGHILYKDGSKGMLLYVKATVTGDESDYILDYERRYPTFPHESTNDQFFSEEQMEAYRALGFHAMRVALDQPPAIQQGTSEAEASRDRLVQELKNSCRSISTGTHG